MSYIPVSGRSNLSQKWERTQIWKSFPKIWKLWNKKEYVTYRFNYTEVPSFIQALSKQRPDMA